MIPAVFSPRGPHTGLVRPSLALILSLALGLALGFALLHPERAAAATPPPRFSWPAFKHFWNVYCLPRCELGDAERNGENYVMYFARGVSVLVVERRSVVTEANVVFTNLPDQMASGQTFLKLIDSAIRIGTFQWPKEKIREVYETFRLMTPEPVTYQWRTSRFERSQNTAGVWLFTLRFVPDEGE